MTLDLRAYQVDQYERARERIRAGVRTLLFQLPTGGGKTVIVAKMLATSAARNYRGWFNVHRRELVKQSVVTLGESAGLNVGIVAAGFPGDRHQQIQVCSIPTLVKRRELLGDPHLIVWDECHHLAARSWGELFEKYPNAVHIGMTATPERLDGTGLGKYFEEMICGPTTADLIKLGYLSPFRLFAPNMVDLSAVHTVGGDYNKKELNAAMMRSSIVGDALDHYRKHASGMRAVVFMWSVASSIDMARRFNEAGIPAAHVDGETDSVTRDRAIDDFKSGRLRVLTNVDLFGEGFDVPAIEAAFLLRPTRSLALYLQQVGRALRMFPGKREALIFDHAGNCRMHGMPDDERVWSLAGRAKEKKRGDAPPIKQCPRCYAASSAAVDSCKHCGYVFIAAPREIEQIEGDLSEVDLVAERARAREAEAQYFQKVDTLDGLIAIGKMRGYKSPERWARAVWKGRIAKKAGEEARRFIMGDQA